MFHLKSFGVGTGYLGLKREIITQGPFCGAYANSEDPDQTPLRAASDHGLD